MPEDLNDKLEDFELMLEGLCSGFDPNSSSVIRVLAYWYDLRSEIQEKME